MPNSRLATIAALSSSYLVGLEQPAAEAILAAAQIQRISAKSNISNEGRRATRLFLLQSGRARFYRITKEGDLVLLAWLEPGDVIGLVTTMKSPPPYMATAEAISDCEVLAWEHSVIRRLVSLHPRLAENALHIALGYLRTYINRTAGRDRREGDTTAIERIDEVVAGVFGQLPVTYSSPRQRSRLLRVR